MPSNPVTITLLVALAALGVYSMVLHPFSNGFYEAVGSIRDEFPKILPASNATLVDFYTGIEPLDYFLTTMQIVFSSIFDMSAPGMTVLAFYFAGQVVPVLVVMMIEGLREGNKGEIVSL